MHLLVLSQEKISNMISSTIGIWNYWIVFLLMMIGLFLVIGRKNFLKKIVGLTIFQTSVFLLYITFGKIKGGTPPILNNAIDTIYSNPLPHVLILTAIVVGVATTALGLSLVLRINSEYGSIEEDDISAQDLVDYHDQIESSKKNDKKFVQ
jgi:multicomponent Na+:H+ antiporter subunit C